MFLNSANKTGFNRLIDWTTNGSLCPRHSSDGSAPLSSNHR